MKHLYPSRHSVARIMDRTGSASDREQAAKDHLLRCPFPLLGSGVETVRVTPALSAWSLPREPVAQASLTRVFYKH